MLIDLLHGVLDGYLGVPGVSRTLYALLGHGRWHDLLHSVVAASHESGDPLERVGSDGGTSL